jgi:hypothetical protein
MSIITILYILIGLQLRKSKIVQRGAVNGSSVRLKVRELLFEMTIKKKQKLKFHDVLWLRKTAI